LFRLDCHERDRLRAELNIFPGKRTLDDQQRPSIERKPIGKSYPDPRNKVLAESAGTGTVLKDEYLVESGSLRRLYVGERFAGLDPVLILDPVFMKLNASAVWVGDLKEGRGVVTTESASLSQSQFSATSYCEEKGTNPYELIAASHAACFSMTLANELVTAGFIPHLVSASATITMEQLPVGWTITGIQLDVLAEAPRLKQGDFIKAALRAKTFCTVSRLLNTNISMSAKLESSPQGARKAKAKASVR
jgi:osmotically inducible protein OsmC